MAFNASSAAPLHPYYPLGVEIVGYMANEWNTLELVSMFAAGCVAIFSATYAILMRTRPNASTGDVSIMMWFVLCGCIHSFFEGYFAYNFRHMGGMQDLFGQLWKEYALSDSRYLTQDAFVLCMETVTAVCICRASAVKSSLTDFGRPSGVPSPSSPPTSSPSTTPCATPCSSSSRWASSTATFSTTRPRCSTTTSSMLPTPAPRLPTTGATSC